MQRLFRTPREELREDQRRFYDAVERIRRAPVQGPFIAAMHASPDMAARVAHLGGYFHDREQADKSILSARVRTLTALLGARALDGVYEWGAWHDRAVDAGVPTELVEAVRERRSLDDWPEIDEEMGLVVQVVSQLLGGQHRLEEQTFDAALEHFGRQGLVELVATLGYFSMIAFPLNVFEIELDREDPPTMPVDSSAP